MPESSFLPEEYLQKRAEQRTVVLCVVLLVLVVAGLVGVYLHILKLESDEMAKSAAVSMQYDEAVQRIEQLEEVETHKEEMRRKASIVAQLVERLPRSRIVAELVNHMPLSMSWEELDLQTRLIPVARPRTEIEAAKARRANGEKVEQTPEPAPLQEIELVLVGLTKTDVQLAQFMSSLQRSPFFEDLNLKYSQEVMIEGMAVRRFRIDLKVNGDIDLEVHTPTLVDRAQLRQNPMGTRVQIGADGLMRSTHEQQTLVDTPTGNGID